MKLIAIDGACYHNGKPDSVACGAFVALDNDDEVRVLRKDIKHTTLIKEGGTNQRGELLGLIAALKYIRDCPGNFLVVTDSEYIFNAMTKDWVHNWRSNHWLTTAGETVKNIDLWKQIYELKCEVERVCEDAPCFYHLKGHIISFGTVTRQRLLEADPTGFDLMLALIDKFNTDLHARQKEVEKAQACSVKNNGFELSPWQLKRFVILNMLADSFASNTIEKYK